MKLLADTSALIEFMRGNEKVRGVMLNADKIYASSLSLFELLIGSVVKEDILEFIYSLDGILPLTRKDSVVASTIYRELKDKGKLIGLVDILIASQAINRRLVLLTKDKDFERIRGLNPILV
ncbi:MULTISPECIES: type II toxin-antitoxin system VapC family toxin [Metallosphaera]|uniref:type II toxin-antitoxin system VapC family toxin n=2 Tax=Sulfolobaceae TaxID=118883 RepID=UPI001F063E40|nr:type II toxin-antitoxin system VapC family toxin [Metallosphaera sedula]MCH1771587.1 type II toxin-antitoxin system VapC family toxin [Metallosphaera sedula]